MDSIIWARTPELKYSFIFVDGGFAAANIEEHQSSRSDHKLK